VGIVRIRIGLRRLDGESREQQTQIGGWDARNGLGVLYSTCTSHDVLDRCCSGRAGLGVCNAQDGHHLDHALQIRNTVLYVVCPLQLGISGHNVEYHGTFTIAVYLC
jgi:hypothetical protein